MHLRGIVLGTGILAAAAAIFAAADNPKLPPPYATPSANNGPRVIPKPANSRLNVPAGFHAEVWSDEGYIRPRYMMLGPNNEVILADSGHGQGARDGKVYVFDKDKHPKAIVEHLYQPYGLAYLNGNLYVGESDSVKRYPYNSKTMTAGPGAEIISLKGQDTHHWTRSLLIDRAGKKIYVGVGSASNVSTGEDPRRAAINEYNLDGSDHQIYAAGTRNPIGIHWYPGTDVMWAGVQERDDLGDDLVPDYFTHIQKGGFYGWPYAYIGPHEDPRNKGLRPDLVAKTIVPDVLLGAHVAVLDFCFYTGKQFPAEYQGGAFLAFHGSWNRSMRVGQSIGFIPFKNGKPAGDVREVLTGWMIAPDKREVWGRPVAVLQMPDGSLLISDDGGQKVWQLSYSGK